MKMITVIASVIFILSCGGQDTRTVIKAYSGIIQINNTPIPGVGMIQLKPGDVIETGKKSFCDLMINDRNLVRIWDNTRVIMNIRTGRNDFGLEKGLITAVTKSKCISEEKYIIKTPCASAEITGRSFCVHAESVKSTYLCTCSGTARIAAEGKSYGDAVTSDHHTSWRFTRGEDGTVTVDPNPGLLYHNDYGIELMARIIKE